MGGLQHLVAFIRSRRPSRVVVLADADEPGQRGAEILAAAARPFAPEVRLITPPQGIKDARAWRMRGADADVILAAVDQAPAHTLKITSQNVTAEVAC
jgi:hypothetical protein